MVRPGPDKPLGNKPAAPNASGGFDVQPKHMYWVSQTMASEQGYLNDVGRGLAQDLNASGAIGRGRAANDLGRAYDTLAKNYLGMWARAVESVGGVATGFTATANAYVEAEHNSNPNAKGSPAKRSLPYVVTKAPTYPDPATLRRDDNGKTDQDIRDIFKDIPDWQADTVDAMMAKVKGVGRLADVYPWADAGDMRKLEGVWRTTAFVTKGVAPRCRDTVKFVTDSGNKEWQAAMMKFCQSLWGTTAWGQPQGAFDYGRAAVSASPNEPVVEVMIAGADSMEKACGDVAKAANTLRNQVIAILRKAAWETFKSLTPLNPNPLPKLNAIKEMVTSGPGPGIIPVVSLFISHIDQAALEKAVKTYEQTLDTWTTTLQKRNTDVTEARRSAPRYRAEEARSQAFGARALREFDNQHHYSVEGDDKKDHFYPIDLASQEGISGSHPIDKHVGQSDEQLAMRLRDQQKQRADGTIAPVAVSSFNDQKTAQRFTQGVLDEVDNAAAIEKWINKQERNPNPQSRPSYNFTFNDPTGYTITRQDFDRNGMSAPAQTTHSVKVTLKYAKGYDPPFVVLTAAPELP